MKLHNVERNLVIWTVVTIICAFPSFRIARGEGFDVIAMLIGILIVITGYTFASSTSFYQNIKTNKIYFYKALKISFILKILNALITIPFNYKTESYSIFIYLIDIYAGIFAFASTKSVLGLKSEKAMKEFFPTLLTTLSEAIIMSLFILFIAFLIWGVIRIWLLIFKRKKNAS
ncbi:MAG: hypothetical protein PQ612_09990 [Rickettsiales bacterium]|nr:hypothetical protein [Pseudomonadota bacterium]MDA0967169.1 hypothetical protein [Pseudomonadota bacterium]MDG4544354.1 hypothetical protein [Rickettsiales bacterium]MDG4546484.1 hypothetical protein [Rickettsiales bacterium]MDG4548630.1 hypothetical protein [Rickettsiales bacterium]